MFVLLNLKVEDDSFKKNRGCREGCIYLAMIYRISRSKSFGLTRVLTFYFLLWDVTQGAMITEIFFRKDRSTPRCINLSWIIIIVYRVSQN